MPIFISQTFPKYPFPARATPFLPFLSYTPYALVNLRLVQQFQIYVVMGTQRTNSELSLQLSWSQLTTTTDSQKAWHIFAVLLAHGLPARPDELTSKCVLFDSSSVEIHFLCSIPNSPISLTPNHFVTLSRIGFAAIVQFVSNANVICTNWNLISEFVPRWIGIPDIRPNDTVRAYYRRRKRLRSDVEDFSVVKRRCFLEISGIFPFKFPFYFELVV